MDKKEERARELLKACYSLFKKQKNSCYVLNLLAETVFYDEVECDGYCLMEDMAIELDLHEEEGY